MNIRALISDLDGTILPRGGVLSTATVEAFRLLGAAGCVRVIATGRNLYSALKVLPPEFPIDYLVFSSGAGVFRWSDRRLLATHHLAEAEARAIARRLWAYNINFTIQRAMPDNHLFYYTAIYPLHEDYRRRLEAYAPFGTPIAAPEEVHGQATQFVVILDALQLHLLEEVRGRLSAYSVVRSTSPLDNRAIWLEIFAPGINKGTACLRLLSSLGIPAEACAGIGNDYNDVDFLEICARPCVVGNAPPCLLSAYPSVSTDKEEGFAEFVGKLSMCH